MKVAAIYAGQTRSFKNVWANHVFHLFRKFEDVSVFCSVADDAEADDMRILSREYPGLSRFEFEKVVQPDIPDPAPRCSHHSGYPPASTPLGIHRQLWALNRGWEFLCEKAKPADFDLFIRVRPDSVFYRVEFVPERHFVSTWVPNPEPKPIGDFTQFIGWEPTLPGPRITPTTLCLTPYWSRWGGINDRFALLGRNAAKVYFTCYQRRQALWDSWCPLHPETMMMQNLRMNGIEPDDTLQAEFGTLRLDGKLVGMDVSAPDMADYARHKL